ncbi:gliding motility-associated peptidyl-prolyl isomerase GldI [Flavobacterium aurantiibacter]|uniref:Peptidyl-prolyl cis-trans isomerase n=1 Tax=Flavobacterium aurantiibacter TaxID=2023067 RepID=A0A255ZQJ6_9FLAO|nr:gliding motility-associated peptidyl-prolyl isomerase GldI [Flavobacterium aurantiibacter]OYQ43837.1 gliding motility-associated peptidyl-prolyl isomerase GldI [Flavobacterium aurantiibacter]
MKKYILSLLILLVVSACSQQQARMPVSRTSGTFMRESVERNKKLVGREEAAIDSVIKSNPKIKYLASSKGYWYFYENKNQNDTLKPKKGDVAYFDYSISDLNGNVIYSEVELRPQTYAVDKQNILMGLRDGIKLMKKKEVVTFLFPSHMAYGFRGDTKRIGPNTTIACTVMLHDFKPETQVNTNPNTPKQ